VTEKALTEVPQPKLGQLVFSVLATPVIHLSWIVRPVIESRFFEPSKELAQVHPLKSKPPKVEKDPNPSPVQSKPEVCAVLHSLFVLEGQAKERASVHPC